MRIDQIVGGTGCEAVARVALRLRDALRRVVDADVFAPAIDAAGLRPLGELPPAGGPVLYHVVSGCDPAVRRLVAGDRPVVVDYHGWYETDRPGDAEALGRARADLHALWGRALAVVVHSRWAEDRLRPWGHARLVRAPPLVDLDGFAAAAPHPPTRHHLEVTAAGPLVVSAGTPPDQVHEVLAAYGMLVSRAEPGARLVVAGDHDTGAARYVKALNLPGAWLAGPVTVDRWAAFVGAADVFVTLGHNDAAAAAALEAMAAGVAVVAARAGAVGEVVGEAGLLLGPGDGPLVLAEVSCARSYLTWADEYPPGTSDDGGVAVHRLPVAAPRRLEVFDPLNGRVTGAAAPVPLWLQRIWLIEQGPRLQGLRRWLAERAGGFDVVVFFTYLYSPTVDGIGVAAALAPVVLHPTAHDEPPFYLAIHQPTFRHATAFAFSTPEEEALVRGRFLAGQPGAVVGIGMDLDAAGDGARFRAAWGLGDDPVLLFLGRVDPAKGADEVIDHFRAYRGRHPGPLRLVVVGDPVRPPGPADDVVVTGYVDDATRADALAAATVFVQPSYFESFSMALCEAWLHRRAALVQGRCEVLAGQARRSGGAIPYHGFAEFEAGLEVLLGDPGLAAGLGRAGRAYVEREYPWDVVLDRYEALLETAAAAHRSRGSLGP
jgi:glycosyltransferase involved in cell wall biosynthesis